MPATPVYIVCSPRPQVGKTLIARLLTEFLLLKNGKVVAFDVNLKEPSLLDYLPNVTETAEIEDTFGHKYSVVIGITATQGTIYQTPILEKIKRITIRDTKSRWGSCTSEGELSFSWRTKAYGGAIKVVPGQAGTTGRIFL